MLKQIECCDACERPLMETGTGATVHETCSKCSHILCNDCAEFCEGCEAMYCPDCHCDHSYDDCCDNVERPGGGS